MRAGEGGVVPPPVVKSLSAWPKLPPQSKPGETPPAASSGWSAAEIEKARARCAELLKGLDVVAIPQTPIREGSECGAPAPVQLVSIGSNPQIAFSPPPLLTCAMVAALHRWLEREVQPLARKHLGAPIVGVATMSSFSCRTAYSRAKSRLSEHGRVNAIDIGAFLTAQGESVQVVADWGPIAREVAAQAAAAQAEATKKQAEAAAARQPKAATAVKPPAVRAQIPGIIVVAPPSGADKGLGLAPPSFLGGPKAADAALTPSGKAAFLRAAHQAACTMFATVLGPEANSAHRNHFHLDMAERKSAAICE